MSEFWQTVLVSAAVSAPVSYITTWVITEIWIRRNAREQR